MTVANLIQGYCYLSFPLYDSRLIQTKIAYV